MESYLTTVERFNAKGRAISHIQKKGKEKATQVEFGSGIPGDTFLVELAKERRGKARTKTVTLVTPSLDRVPIVCRHADICGGCRWQALSYSKQLDVKQKKIEELFLPLLSIEAQIKQIIPCDSIWNYRSKMEFTFSQNKEGARFLGLMLSDGRGRVFNIEECAIASSWMVEAASAIRKWWESSTLLAYYPPKDRGSLRTLTLREGKGGLSRMAILTVSGSPCFALSRKQIDDFAFTLTTLFPDISCFLRIQQAMKGSPTQIYEWHLSGKDHLEDTLHIDFGNESVDLELRMSPSSFLQPNKYQVGRLYSECVHLLNPDIKDCIVDLYAGMATIAMAFSRRVERVTAIEINPYAVFDAKANLLLNHIDNIDVIQDDAEKALLGLQKRLQQIDAIIVDPPRNGLGLKAAHLLARIEPKKILYISCNPTTQAIDVKEIIDAGYQIVAIQPIDQFPHTYHCENIVLLHKKF